MTNQEYTLYDFRQAGASDESSIAFRTWVTKSSQAFKDLWSGIANTEVALSLADIRTQSLDAAMRDVPVANLCCTFGVNDQESPSIWHLSETDGLKIVADLLDMPESAQIDERELTETETALVRAFFDTFAKSIEQGWLGQNTLRCDVQACSTNPKRIRLCRGSDFVTTSSITLGLPRGGVTIHWVSKKQEMADLLDQVVERRRVVSPQSDPQAVVEQLPLEVVGLLGEFSISMRRLANISVGDVVRLDQRIDRPIVAAVDGQPFFECWPGKIGETIGLEISNCLPSGAST